MKKKELIRELASLDITYVCPNLKKEITVKAPSGNLSFTGSSDECEICGSHGSVDLCIYNCECGVSHDICLNSW